MSTSDRERYFRNLPHRVPLGYEDYAGDKQFATTLARGIELLRCFSVGETELSNAELSKRTGLPRPTVTRLTYTLTVLGYLRREARSGRFALGSALISATYPLMASMPLRQQARPLMNALAEATGGQVSMGVRDRLNIVLVETSRHAGRHHAAGPVADIGLSVPMAGSAIGRAYLAGCEPAHRQSLLNMIRVQAPQDWAAFEPRIKAALREHGRVGYCSIDGDLVDEVVAVGACLVPTRGEPLAFNCAFLRSLAPRQQTVLDWLKRDVGPRLRRMVDELKLQAR